MSCLPSTDNWFTATSRRENIPRFIATKKFARCRIPIQNFPSFLPRLGRLCRPKRLPDEAGVAPQAVTATTICVRYLAGQCSPGGVSGRLSFPGSTLYCRIAQAGEAVSPEVAEARPSAARGERTSIDPFADGSIAGSAPDPLREDQMKVTIGTGPDSWGVWFADDPRQTPWRRFMDEVVQAGYQWIELGPYGYLPTEVDVLERELKARGLGVTGTCVMAPLEDPAAWPEIERQVLGAGPILNRLGARHLVLIDDTYSDMATGVPRGPSGWIATPGAGWSMSRIAWPTSCASDSTWPGVSSPLRDARRIRRPDRAVSHRHRSGPRLDLFRRRPPCLSRRRAVGFHPPAPRAAFPYLHLKSVDKAIQQRVAAEDIALRKRSALGIFCEPDRGLLDFRRLATSWRRWTSRASALSNRTCIRLRPTSRCRSPSAPERTCAKSAWDDFTRGRAVWGYARLAENVQVGDRVLSQNRATGELCYRVVLEATLGNQPLLTIDTGDDQIVATLGHVFWVSGTGWRMAKQLQLGDRLHTAGSWVEIRDLKKTPADETHNLVVADTQTFFVGKDRILVHDYSLLQPTTAKVPGQGEQ